MSRFFGELGVEVLKRVFDAGGAGRKERGDGDADCGLRGGEERGGGREAVIAGATYKGTGS